VEQGEFQKLKFYRRRRLRTMPWEKNKEPPCEERILVSVTTKDANEYWVCTVDHDGTLIDAYGDDLGWEYESIDEWILFEEVLKAIERKDTSDNRKLSEIAEVMEVFRKVLSDGAFDYHNLWETFNKLDGLLFKLGVPVLSCRDYEDKRGISDSEREVETLKIEVDCLHRLLFQYQEEERERQLGLPHTKRVPVNLHDDMMSAMGIGKIGSTKTDIEIIVDCLKSIARDRPDPKLVFCDDCIYWKPSPPGRKEDGFCRFEPCRSGKPTKVGHWCGKGRTVYGKDGPVHGPAVPIKPPLGGKK
jgi:hypothetical protein